MEWPDELVIQLILGPRTRHYIVPLQVAEHVVLEMLPEPNVGRSILSERARLALIMAEIVPPTDEPATCPLRGLRIQEQAIPDLDLPVSAVVERVDGILGLDFFRRYRSVEFDPQTFRLVLRK